VKKDLDAIEAKYNITEQTNEEVEKGVVLETDQAEGTEISASTTINLKVSAGSQYKDVTMISVIGKTEEEAKGALNGIGINDIDVEFDENTSKTDGIVLRQSIAVGTVVKENQKVTIVINKHPVKSTVTVNVNLKSIFGDAAYTTVTTPVTTTPTTTDSNTANGTNTTETTTTTQKVQEPKKAKVVIQVGEETVFSETKELTSTNISAKYTGTGVKEIKLYVDGVLKSSGKSVDLSKGDSTVTIE